MIVADRIDAVRKTLDEARSSGRRVGFVPTMGALHAGHVSLIERARAENDLVVVSIFVNPAQFGPDEDFTTYPRPLDADLAICDRAGVDLVFAPGTEELYSRPPVTRIVVSGVSESMEGAHRPGHFDGVALVVCKLFNVVGSCRAYFGQKDAQQLRVVSRMVDDLDLPVEVVGCPIVRDADGLALSSRNVYLSTTERERALALPRALRAIECAARDGERDTAALRAAGLRTLEEGGVDEVDYLEIVDPETLEALTHLDGSALVCAAVRVGRTRLIDNVLIGREG